MGEQVGQLAVISRLNVTVFNEAVKKCCYSDEECKIAFVGVGIFSSNFICHIYCIKKAHALISMKNKGKGFS